MNIYMKENSIDIIIEKKNILMAGKKISKEIPKLVNKQNDQIDKNEIRNLLPHREPMLLNELYDIKKLSSATAIVNVKKNSFCSSYFSENQLCRVLIVNHSGKQLRP